MDVKKRALIAASMAGLLTAASLAVTQTAQAKDKDTDEVACYGINACKGKGDCGGKGHSCAGKNECKGKGYVEVHKDKCLKISGGSLTPVDG